MDSKRIIVLVLKPNQEGKENMNHLEFLKREAKRENAQAEIENLFGTDCTNGEIEFLESPIFEKLFKLALASAIAETLDRDILMTVKKENK